VSNIITKIGQIIKEKRLIKGYSTQELAEILNVSTGLINNIENGKTDTFNLNFMDKICNILDISVLSILLGESGKPDELKELLDITCNITKRLSNDINDIIEAYLHAATILNYDAVKLEKLRNKIIFDIEFILNFYH
jgi:transcriptional regulator with XRE-family HTH domain